jgi:hypothetical protein
VTNTTQENLTAFGITEALKSWVMVILTLAFAALYGLALIGKLKPLADVSMVSRIEPIIFVIIGYYFGRLPSQQNEKTLKEEIIRHTQKADAAQHAKENALQTREAVEEKLKNINATLEVGLNPSRTELHNNAITEGDRTSDELALRHSVAAAQRILNA